MPDPTPEGTPDFDPRYDPRFQPGYDADAHAPRSRPMPADDPAESDDIPIYDAADLAHGGPVDRVETETQDADAEASRSETALLLRNPFVWLLVVLGAALVAWSWTSYSAAVETTSDIFSGGFGSNEQTQAEYASAQFSLGIAPFTLAVGLLVLAGVVFFAAATWKRERAAQRGRAEER